MTSPFRATPLARHPHVGSLLWTFPTQLRSVTGTCA